MPSHRSPLPRLSARLFGRGSSAENLRVGEILRRESVGGGLLVAAALVALILANSPLAPGYEALRELRLGPEALHLNLTLSQWASDGLLALFFFLVGLELKQEFVAGDLQDPRKALVPVVAAVGGVATPALIFVLVNLGNAGAVRGWAIPTATDIAFAVAVLALIGSHLPTALRTFLLTLAVVDDLIAIVIIAIFYTTHLDAVALAAAAVPIALYAFLVQRFRPFFARHAAASWATLVPLGAVAWALLHASGIHATLAGVALGLCVPVRRRDGREDLPGLAHVLEMRIRPLSAGLAVPVFAFFAAGVTVGGLTGLASALTDPLTLGVIAGLVFGKPLGIVASTWALTRATKAELDESVTWLDLTGVGMLAGIGFTVSLLISELSFGVDTPAGAHAKVGVLSASLVAALAASALLIARNRRYRTLELAGADEG